MFPDESLVAPFLKWAVVCRWSESSVEGSLSHYRKVLFLEKGLQWCLFLFLLKSSGHEKGFPSTSQYFPIVVVSWLPESQFYFCSMQMRASERDGAVVKANKLYKSHSRGFRVILSRVWWFDDCYSRFLFPLSYLTFNGFHLAIDFRHSRRSTELWDRLRVCACNKWKSLI